MKFVDKKIIRDRKKNNLRKFKEFNGNFQNETSRKVVDILVYIQATSYSIRLNNTAFLSYLMVPYRLVIEYLVVSPIFFEIRFLNSQFTTRGAARYLTM